MSWRLLIAFMLFPFTSVLAQYDSAYIESDDSYEESSTDNENGYTNDYVEGESDENSESVHTIAPDALPVTKQYQTETIPVRKFDDKKWKAIVGTETFEEDAEKRQERKPRTPIGPLASAILRIVFYVLILGLIIFLLYVIMKNISFEQRIKTEKLTADDLAEPVENIEDLDTQSLLKQALAEGNF